MCLTSSATENMTNLEVNENLRPVTSTLLHPFWQIRSEYHEALRRLREDIEFLRGLSPQIHLAIKALDRRELNHPLFPLLVLEAATTAELFCSYVSNLKKLLWRVKLIYQSLQRHQLEMFDEYSLSVDYDPDLCEGFSHHLIHCNKVAAKQVSFLEESIRIGTKAWIYSLAYLMDIFDAFYKLSIPLPDHPYCHTFMEYRLCEEDGLNFYPLEIGTGEPSGNNDI